MTVSDRNRRATAHYPFQLSNRSTCVFANVHLACVHSPPRGAERHRRPPPCQSHVRETLTESIKTTLALALHVPMVTNTLLPTRGLSNERAKEQTCRQPTRTSPIGCS